MRYHNYIIQEIRILPMSSEVFHTSEAVWKFLSTDLVDRNGYYYYMKKGMDCKNNTLVLFQYHAALVGSGVLIDRQKEPYTDDAGDEYSGHFVFDVNTLEVFKESVTLDEYKRKIDAQFTGFTRAKPSIDLQYLDKVIKMIEAHTSGKPQDISEAPLVTVVYGGKDGKQKQYYTTRYERNPRTRAAAIQIHGCKCAVCGFDFEKTYGELGKGFIEVHHIKPLATLDEEVEIDPEKDLVCLCSNCHRMIHRKRIDNRILSVEELKKICMESRKAR